MEVRPMSTLPSPDPPVAVLLAVHHIRAAAQGHDIKRPDALRLLLEWEDLGDLDEGQRLEVLRHFPADPIVGDEL